MGKKLQSTFIKSKGMTPKITQSSKQRGIVLVSVLAIFSIVIATISIIAYEVHANNKKASMYINRIQAKQNAFAIERYSLEYIANNIKKTNSININNLTKFPYEIVSGTVTTQVIDQNSLFNLSWLIEPKSIGNTKEHDRHQTMLAVLRQMLALCSLSTQIADQLNDIINNKNPSKHYITSKNDTRTENNYNIKKIFDISCINLLENITAEDKQKLSQLLTVLPIEAKLNLNTADKIILQSIDDIFGINISNYRETTTKQYKSWQDISNLFIDSNNNDIISSLKKLPIGFNSNFISLYITSKNNDFSFLMKSDIFYSKNTNPKVIARELGPNYQWLLVDTEYFENI